MMQDPLDRFDLARLYPNTFSFAAGDPPQRGGSRAAFDALCFERKTLLLPPPYTFTLSRAPTSTRLSNTYRETFDFANQEGDASEEGDEDTCQPLSRRIDPTSALFHSIPTVPQPRSVLKKSCSVEPHTRSQRSASCLGVNARGDKGSRSRLPRVNPPYRTDDPPQQGEAEEDEEPLAKSSNFDVALKCLSRKEEENCFGIPLGKPWRVRITEPCSHAALQPPRETGGPSLPLQGEGGALPARSVAAIAPPCRQESAPLKTVGRRNLATSFVCRAHKGRHLHLVDVNTPFEVKRFGDGTLARGFPAPSRRGAAAARGLAFEEKDCDGRGQHLPNCGDAVSRLRRCGFNEAELPTPAEVGAIPERSRVPFYWGSAQGFYPTEEEAFERQLGGVAAEKAQFQSPTDAVANPKRRAAELGLHLKYFLRNYSDPQLLAGGGA
ncbi:bax inhibitor related protein [Cyclospora cayetanensis]|uniref:Bax inhibitor related protein n=1 Tax=Cyclospora cayetanensis TaxID=88456 RepID=A0A1D3CSA2_9EIME|nr:bax inhibitor related protein [Cyclospora cayetanensis]